MLTTTTTSGLARTLGAITGEAEHLQTVQKTDLQFGDRVLVQTAHSLYSIHVLGGGEYLVSGGWFDRKGLSPFRTSIPGCTWGGSAIKTDVIAACGLHLEFGNRVITSSIRRVQVFRHHSLSN